MNHVPGKSRSNRTLLELKWLIHLWEEWVKRFQSYLTGIEMIKAY